MTIQQDGTAALDSFRMLKKAANLTLPPQARQDALLPVARPQAMPTPQVYPLGYIEDVGEPRTKLGKGRVLARLGQGG